MPSTIATFNYFGPPVTACGNPIIIFADALGLSIPFLNASFDSASRKISVNLPDRSIAVKSTFLLQAVFSSPGPFSFSLGIGLTVFDSCNSSYFDAAPVLSPDNQAYYTGQGNLVVAATYLKDYITRTTSFVCGPYTIDAKFNSVSSTFSGGSVNSTLTNLTVIDANNLRFYSNQPSLSGTLKYDVKILSSAFSTPSPVTTWTLNLFACN